MVSREKVENIVGPLPSYEEIKGKLGSDYAPNGYLPFNVDITYVPTEWGRKGITSSWSDSVNVAKRFSQDSATTSSNFDYRVGVIFTGQASAGNFLDITQIYRWEEMGDHEEEEERLALGPVPVNRIEVYYPQEFEERSW